MLDDVPFDKIGLPELERLRDNEVAEGRTIEYKDEDPTAKGDPQRDFREAVTSFANTDGGYLLYGARADRTKAVPIDFPGISVNAPDKFELTLNQTLRDRTDPRVAPVEYRWIEVSDGRRVVVVRIQRSWSGPHAATKFGPYYIRTSRGKQPMDANELRDAFLLAGRAEDRFRQFCEARDNLILSIPRMASDPRLPCKLQEGAVLAIHAAPLAAMSRRYVLDIRANIERLKKIRPRHMIDGYSVRTCANLNGFLAADDADRVRTYWQVFRSGAVEAIAVFPPRLSPGSMPDAAPCLYAGWVEQTAVGEAELILRLFTDLGLSSPTLLRLALYKASGYWLQAGSTRRPVDLFGQTLGHHFAPLGTVVAESDSEDAPTLLRPAFDTLWNAFGRPGSQNFSADGKWTPPKD